MEKQIRKLARTVYYQNIYNAIKECSGIHLFENVSNISGLQTLFLYWLGIYSMLYQELSTQEDDLLTERVIEDDVRCDAYLMHRKKKIDKFWKNRRREERLAEIKQKHPNAHNSGNTTLIETQFYRENEG